MNVILANIRGVDATLKPVAKGLFFISALQTLFMFYATSTDFLDDDSVVKMCIRVDHR